MNARAVTAELFADARAPLAKARVSPSEAVAYFYDVMAGAARYLEPLVLDFARRRRRGKLGAAALVREVDFWRRFPPMVVVEAARTWVEKRYGADGLGERYFRGIVRELARQAQARRARRGQR